MRKLIAAAVVLLSVQMLHAGTIVLTPPPVEVECGYEQEKIIVEKKITVEDLQIWLKQCKDENQGLEDENFSLEEELQKWKCLAQEEIAKNAALVKANNNLKIENANQRNTINALQAANAELTACNSECSNKLELCNSQLKTCNNYVTDLECKKKALEDANKALTEKCEQDAREAADKIKILLEENGDLKCQLNDLRQRLARCEEECNTLKKSLDEAKSNYDQLLVERNRALDHIAYLEEAIRKEELDDKALQSHIDELRQQIECLTRELNECKIRNKELEGQVECLRNDLAEQTKTCQNRIDDLEEKLRNKDIECKAALDIERQKTLAALCRITELEKIIEDLRQQLCKKQEELDECINDRNACRKQIEILQQRIGDLEEENGRLRKELDELQCRYNDLLNELAECRENLKKCQIELNNCREELACARNTIEQLQRRILELEDAKQKCEQELDDLRCEADHFVNKIKVDSETITADINKVAQQSSTLTNVIIDFLSNHKLGCKEEQCEECGYETDIIAV